MPDADIILNDATVDCVRELRVVKSEGDPATVRITQNGNIYAGGHEVDGDFVAIDRHALGRAPDRPRFLSEAE